MELLELLTEVIGLLAWPVAAIVVALSFKSEISKFLQRVKNAKYMGVELDLEKEFSELKAEATDAGVTIMYAPSSFDRATLDSLEDAPELAFIRSWQEIENVVVSHYGSVSGLKAKEGRFNFGKAVKYLRENGTINAELEMLIQKLRQTRNLVVHGSDVSVSRAEAFEWLGISKSVLDRLKQKIGTD